MSDCGDSGCRSVGAKVGGCLLASDVTLGNNKSACSKIVSPARRGGIFYTDTPSFSYSIAY